MDINNGFFDRPIAAIQTLSERELDRRCKAIITQMVTCMNTTELTEMAEVWAVHRERLAQVRGEVPSG